MKYNIFLFKNNFSISSMDLLDTHYNENEFQNCLLFSAGLFALYREYSCFAWKELYIVQENIKKDFVISKTLYRKQYNKFQQFQTQFFWSEIVIPLFYINIFRSHYLYTYLLFHCCLILSETSLTSPANLLPSSLHELMNVLACMLVYVCLHRNCYYYEFPVSTAP